MKQIFIARIFPSLRRWNQVAVVRAVVRGPQDHLLAAPRSVRDVIAVVGRGAHPADAVVMHFLVDGVGPGRRLRANRPGVARTPEFGSVLPERCDDRFRVARARAAGRSYDFEHAAPNERNRTDRD